MRLTLKIWRQENASAPGALQTYDLDGVSADMSFLEMLDVLNEKLQGEGQEPVAFDHDCREGICGACSLMINGEAHGPEVTTTCQLHMRSFNDGDTITIEPWRSDAFPVVRDLIVDRSAFDRIIQSGGFISANTGSAPEANSVPAPRDKAMRAFNVATCIGCGACVAACPTTALHFGDLADPDTAVSRLVAERDGKELLPELNYAPNSRYLPPKPQQSGEDGRLRALAPPPAPAEGVEDGGFLQWIDRLIAR